MGAHDIAIEAMTERQYADDMGRLNNELRARIGWLESANEDQYDQLEELARTLSERNRWAVHDMDLLATENKRLQTLAEQRGADLRAATKNKGRRGATIKRQRAEIAEWKDLAEQQRLSLVSMRKMLPASCR